MSHVILSKDTQKTSNIKKAPDTPEMEKIWQSYTQLIQRPQKTKSKTIENIKKSAPAQIKPAPQKPGGMAAIMQRYENAKAARSTVKTLTFKNEPDNQ